MLSVVASMKVLKSVITRLLSWKTSASVESKSAYHLPSWKSSEGEDVESKSMSVHVNVV